MFAKESIDYCTIRVTILTGRIATIRRKQADHERDRWGLSAKASSRHLARVERARKKTWPIVIRMRSAYFSDFSNERSTTLTKRIAVLVAAGILISWNMRTINVKAQTGCSLQSLSVPYTYALNGSYFSVQGSLYGFSSAGRFVPDGNGNFVGTDTISDGAVITRGRQYTGTYTVNSNDCTGSAVFLNNNVPLAHMDFVITNNAKNINFIQTDNGTDIAGTAQQQFPSQ